MKRSGAFIFLVVSALILALSSSGLSKPGDAVKTISLPFHHPTGIAWDGKYAWIADRGADMFYKIDCSKGIVADSLTSPAYSPSGLAWDGKLLWSTDPGARKIYATDVKNGLTVKTIDAPSPSPTGIAWDGKYLWISDNRSDMIAKIDPEDGTTISSFRSPAPDSRGITFGRGYLWCADRIRDRIYMIDPKTGIVVMILQSPGPFIWGLAWQDGFLLNTDYETNKAYKLITRDDETLTVYATKREQVDLVTDAVATGNGAIKSLTVTYAVPVNRANQKLLSEPTFTPSPKEFEKDQWGQKVAIFEFDNLKAGDKVKITMHNELETSAIRYFIYPEDVGDKIPDKIAKFYLADGMKYDINNNYIQGIVKKVVGDETNIYWKARKLFQYLIANMEYEMVGGWNTAPTVLKRGNGSCSEYSFSYIALCRAAGIPARYVGSLVIRGDDASYDKDFHRWCEIYLPGYGWIPVDANAGDRDWPGDQAAAFGGISNRFLITTVGGGASKYLGWNYDLDSHWVASGKCSVFLDSSAEWQPLD
ncbi:MAG: hypothetical protein B6D63_03970 [Candidatus Latescibacteria bacterium 4484_7]|nr:MAG: hypothetical protein B6D63_03970 [Candidatus Latescibacteria bacterium 4484_7]